MDDTGEEAAVRASLDSALGDLLRVAVENPAETGAASCARINAVFDYWMTPYRHLAWALAEAEGLKRRLKAGLYGHPLNPDGASSSSEHHDLREPNL